MIAYVEINYPQKEEIYINGVESTVSAVYVEDELKLYSYNRTYTVRLNKNYTNTLNYLIQKGYDINNVEKVEVLPYHTLGVFKWEELGIDYQLEGIQPPTAERVENAHKRLHVEDYK
jgi:pyruvate formate lyase activating enzyme